MKFIRENVIVAGVVAIIRIMLGWSWMTAGWGKIVNNFDATGYLNNAVNNPVMDNATGTAMYPTYTWFIETFALPNVKMINIMIAWGEFLVGIGLIVGTLTLAATFFGLLMNFMFLFAGTISSNPYMVVLSLIIMAAGANAGKFGGDYYVMPYLKAKYANFRKKDCDMMPGDSGEVLSN